MSEPEADIFLGSEIANGAPEQAAFHVIPVPFERSTSYGSGTAAGPDAILEASWQLETWDGESNPSLLGIHTQPAVPIGDDVEAVMMAIATATARAVAVGAMPVAIGGEHTVTCGVVRGLQQSGIGPFGVVQIDAHADLRDRYEGNPYSHASVMRRVVEAGIPLVQLGVRACCEEELQARREFGVLALDARELVVGNCMAIELPADFPAQVFFTVDVDGLDPSVFPSTGTPVPGGLGWYQTLALFESVARQRRIIGFDVMEFAPIPGFHAYQFAAAQLIYKFMGICQRTQALGR
ncbi:MAG TPA: agmatinase [Porticoccaceae bacterium]|nr:agmatinase [Porticoccaceae bacterium]